MSSPQTEKPWTFVTNHTQVMLCIDDDHDVRVRDIAQMVGVTERAAQRIVSDLIEAGYITRTREGRRNRYTVNHSAPMRHQAQDGHAIGELLDLFKLESENGSSATTATPPPTPRRRGRKRAS